MSAVERRPHAPPRPKPPAAAEGRGAGLLAKKARRFEQRATGKRRSASSSRERPAPKRQRTGSQLTSVRSNAYFAKALSKAEKLVRYWKDPSKQIPIVFKALTKSHESDTNLKQEIDLSNRKLMMAESPPINEATRDKSLARHGNNKKTKVVPAQQKHKKSNR